jgi:uncharacterized protein YjiS (DUF1127 family)
VFTSFVLAKIRAWLIFRNTVHELASLDDKDLSDLGIRRSDIKAVAWEAARTA